MYSVLRLAIIAIVSITVAGCERSESYRYKLAMTLNTPDGVKKASSVVQLTFREVSIPERGIMHRLNGEALYLDLGVGRKPLVALLMYLPEVRPYREDQPWGNETGPSITGLLSRLYGPIKFNMDEVARISRMRGAHQITSNDLPVLVTFTNIDDPASVTIVDPNNLEATLGTGVSWNEITLEITDEQITTGIEKKLPWVVSLYENNFRLDGDKIIRTKKKEVANKLGWESFAFSSEFLKRPRS